MTDVSDNSQAVMQEKLKGLSAEIKLHALQIVMVDINSIKPNGYNPNKQSEQEFELLCRSITKDGWTSAVIVNKDMTVIDGEHRWRAGQKIGKKTIPVVVLDLDDIRMKIATVRHNKARGTHDAQLEAMVLADIEKVAGAAFIQSELMINADDLAQILSFESAPAAYGQEPFNNAWEPVRGTEAFNVDENNQPKVNPDFKGRTTMDGAVVLSSLSDKANNEAFEKVVNKSQVEDLHMISGVYDLAGATLISNALKDANTPGNSPADKFAFICQQYLEEVTNE